MANKSRVSTGTLTATGSSLPVVCGFKPSAVDVFNKDGLVVLKWNESMADAAGYKIGSGGSSFSTLAEADIKGSANTDSENTDAASLPTNGALLYADAAISGLTFPLTITTNPDIPRNVLVVIANKIGGGTSANLFQGVSTYTITGTYKGAAQTETITFTSSSGNKAVADTKFRYKYGVKAFDTVTSVACDNLPGSTLDFSLGIGSKVGLPNALFGAAAGSVVKITKSAADLSPSGIVDTTNNTVNFGAVSANDDITVVYKIAAAAHSFITTLGVTPSFNGFTIGADTDVNVNTNVLYWTAWRG